MVSIDWSNIEELRRAMSSEGEFGEIVSLTTRSRARGKILLILTFMLFALCVKVFGGFGAVEFIWPIWVVANAYYFVHEPFLLLFVILGVIDLTLLVVGLTYFVRGRLETRNVSAVYGAFLSSGALCWPVYPRTLKHAPVVPLRYETFLRGVVVVVGLSGSREAASARLEQAARYLEDGLSPGAGKAEVADKVWHSVSDELPASRNSDGSVPMVPASRLWADAPSEMWLAPKVVLDTDVEPVVKVGGVGDEPLRCYRLSSRGSSGWHVRVLEGDAAPETRVGRHAKGRGDEV